MEKETITVPTVTESRKISVRKAKELVLACYHEKTAEDKLCDEPFYRYQALRIAREISIDAYGNAQHDIDFYNMFSALLGFTCKTSEPIEALKSLGFELVD